MSYIGPDCSRLSHIVVVAQARKFSQLAFWDYLGAGLHTFLAGLHASWAGVGGLRARVQRFRVGVRGFRAGVRDPQRGGPGFEDLASKSREAGLQLRSLVPTLRSLVQKAQPGGPGFEDLASKL